MKKEPKFIRCTKCKHKLKIRCKQESWGFDCILICDACCYGVSLGYDSEPEMSLIKEDYRHAIKDIFEEEIPWNKE